MKKILLSSLAVLLLSSPAFAVTKAEVVQKAQADIDTIEAAAAKGKIQSHDATVLEILDSDIEHEAMKKHGSESAKSLLLGLADNQVVFQSDEGQTTVYKGYTKGKLTQAQEQQLDNSYIAISQQAQNASRSELQALHIELQDTKQMVKMDEGK